MIEEPAHQPQYDRLHTHLAHEILTGINALKTAHSIASAIVESQEVQDEIRRIASAHADGSPCLDRRCRRCYETRLAAAAREEAKKTCTCKHPTPESPVGHFLHCDSWDHRADMPRKGAQ